MKLVHLFRILPARKLLLAVLIALYTSGWPQSKQLASDRRNSVGRGAWSSKTISLFNTWGGLDSNPGRKLRAASPDGSKVIEINGEEVVLLAGGRRYKTDFGKKTNAELGWAPDSHHFFLTWTDGGETGTWFTQVYVASDSGWHELRGISDLARKDFARMITEMPKPKGIDDFYWSGISYCAPNVVGSQWLAGSTEILLSVLVPNTSRCRQMSEFDVYRIAVPGGKILERYSAREAHRKFDPANLPKIVK
jgi:hypothetical protein